MPKMVEHEGKEEEMYSAEEVAAAAEARAKEEAAKVAAAKDTEIEGLKRINVEKTDNFKKFNEMTEEERKAYDANTLNLIKRGDQLADELASEKKVREEREKADREHMKTSTLKNIHAGSEEVKTKVEKHYAELSGMPETTQEEVNARAVAAARLAGITIDERNPLYQTFAGEAPKHTEKSEYIETPEGKEAARLAREAMGLPAEPKQ